MNKKLKALQAENSELARQLGGALADLDDSRERHARATAHVGEAKREAGRAHASLQARLDRERMADERAAREREAAERRARLDELSKGNLSLSHATQAVISHDRDGAVLTVEYPLRDAETKQAVEGFLNRKRRTNYFDGLLANVLAGWGIRGALTAGNIPPIPLTRFV